MLAWLDNWIIQTDADGTYRREHLLILLAMLVVGTIVRFWGLGNVGLHGDEETMALPTMSILETGIPLLPSGMFYPRAIGQLYLMAASVSVFGESEWALRLPSAIVGSIAGIIAFFLGRRFLSPSYNLIFVAVMTFLPYMIEISQTARMYVFFTTSLMLFGVLIFRWERDATLINLLLAFLTWLTVLHFHALAIFGSPLFLYPGIAQRSVRRLIAGGAAMALAYVAFGTQARWINGKYPSGAERLPNTESAIESAETEIPLANTEILDAISTVGVVGGLLLVVALAYIGRPRERGMWLPAIFLMAGVLACSMYHYHIGAIMLLVGSVTWNRESRGYLSRLSIIFAALAALAAAQLYVLYNSGDFPGRSLIGAIVGLPSIWPLLRFSEYSPGAVILFALAAAIAVFRLSKNQPVPDFFMLFSIAVWGPLFLVGFFSWYVPPRYTLGALPFFLLCCVAGLAYIARNSPLHSTIVKSRALTSALAVALTLVIVNPNALSQVINVDYSSRPDHKGAAEFVLSLPLKSNDIVVAEDALQQRYYLGRTDYWLLNIEFARQFAVVRGSELRDQYTGATVLGSGAELTRVLEMDKSGDLYIIGSGENFTDGRRRMRGNGISEVLGSDKLEPIFTGRDGYTVVWRLQR